VTKSQGKDYFVVGGSGQRLEHSNVRSGKLGPLACSDQKNLFHLLLKVSHSPNFNSSTPHINPLHSAISLLAIRHNVVFEPHDGQIVYGDAGTSIISLSAALSSKNELERSPGGRVADVETSRRGLRPSYTRMLSSHWATDSMNSRSSTQQASPMSPAFVEV